MKKLLTILSIAVMASVSISAQPKHITVQEFRSMSDKDTTTVVLNGIVTTVRNFEYGNLYISDGTAEVLIYGIIGKDGSKNFAALDVAKGDSLTVVGRRSVYDRFTIEMKDARFVSRVCGPDHKVMFDSAQKPDVFPKFKGKNANSFSLWVTNHLNYPSAARNSQAEGQVLVKFVIDTDGSVTDVEVLEGIHPALDAEAVRVINKSPRWKPGTKNGSPVRVSYTFPVIFSLQ